MNRRLGVLISGRGSNLQAIIDAIGDGRLDAEIAVVISNRADAAGLERARSAGIETIYLDHRGFAARADYDRAVVSELRTRDVGLVCLAGFMRLLSPAFVEAFPNAILNIHPALLPSFPGLDAQHQAWEHGTKISGVTVHLVNAELDAGPIILQAAVPVRDDDTPETLAARILVEEHRLYPEAIKIVLNGHWTLAGRRFILTPRDRPRA
jgi:phosphoribosylglycinamide formyltransferase 1